MKSTTQSNQPWRLSHQPLNWLIFILTYSTILTFGPQSAYAYHRHHANKIPLTHMRRQGAGNLPVTVTNGCDETIYPAILTQSGSGPETGGFQLTSGSQKTLTVSEDWQGRVWGRTNCSFNSAGTSSATGNGIACSTGDCGSIVDCRGAGENPATLAEFTMDTGSGQSFYDISLVDGYNLPLAIVMHPNSNFTFDQIPPNLTNPSCVGSSGELASANYNPYSDGDFLGTNATYPLPFDTKVTSSQVSTWCPWELQVNAREGPRGGVYTYPDGGIERSTFNPCLSACARFNTPAACCTGAYDSPSACTPSAYSKAAKAICPDAYSYAFDDQTSTFIIPSGAGKGFEVVFCPGARSTNILGTSKAKLVQLAQTGVVSLSKRNVAVPNRATHDDLKTLRQQGRVVHKSTPSLKSEASARPRAPLALWYRSLLVALVGSMALAWVCGICSLVQS